jgi:sugar (pentulose or hexulose) kinase
LSNGAKVKKARPEAVAVFDVGKSNVRLSAVNDAGVAMLTLDRQNSVDSSPPYPHFDADALYAWLLDGLATLARDFEIHSVVPVTHGACAALVDDDGLVLPIIDYEFRGVGDVDSEYDAIARDFAHTASPKLPAGLNLGRQLFWQQRQFPGEFSSATIVPYPQYWAARLSGVRAWEPTSLGCHTDLWDPRGGDFSTFAKSMGWDSRFGRRVCAWTPLGSPLPEVVAATGLSNGCQILTGIHDSNASYLAHRASRATEEEPFCVVSTGTWFIMMAHGSPLELLREEMDMLANVDAFGEPVATARFMGGREYAEICGSDGLLAHPSVAALEAVLASGPLALPSFADQGGPFSSQASKIVGHAPTAPRYRAALAALYCALMTDYCLTLLEATGDVIVEGRLASNEAFTSALAALRAPQPVFRSLGETGSLHGAVLLSLIARGKNAKRTKVDRCRPGPADKLNAARRKWRSLLPANHR